jgi:hypothetical protein
MSHHLDTPLARQNGQLYIDDLYVFPGLRDGTFPRVTFTHPTLAEGLNYLFITLDS